MRALVIPFAILMFGCFAGTVIPVRPEMKFPPRSPVAAFVRASPCIDSKNDAFRLYRLFLARIAENALQERGFQMQGPASSDSDETDNRPERELLQPSADSTLQLVYVFTVTLRSLSFPQNPPNDCTMGRVILNIHVFRASDGKLLSKHQTFSDYFGRGDQEMLRIFRLALMGGPIARDVDHEYSIDVK